MSRNLKLLAILLFATLTVAACGKRGTLERPSSVAAEGEEAPAAKAEPEEHRGTILDGLLL